MRVMAWTADGLVELGRLPEAPPAAPPRGRWYVEPIHDLDDAAYAKVVAAVRSEHVPGLSLRRQRVAGRLAGLRELPELEVLILDDTLADSAGVLAIDAPLRRLYLARTQVTDEAILGLAARPALAMLEALDVEDCAITDRGAAAIATLRELRAVNLAGTRITDAGGAELGKLAKLAVVDLGGTAVAERTVAALRPLALVELYLDHTRVGKELATLGGFAPGLARFEVSALASEYRPTDADLAWLAAAPNLVEVGLANAAVHDPLVLAIASRPGLRELRLAGTPITRTAIHRIAQLIQLEEVDLAETPVDDASAAALLGMPHMRGLRLDRTAITDAAFTQVATPSPALTELYVSHTQLGDAALAVLDALPKLEALGVGETRITDPTIVRIGKLVALETLVLSQARTSRGVLVELGGLTKLERLYLDHTRADDTTLVSLEQLVRLRVLHLEGTRITDEALPRLRSFHLLDELTVGATHMRNGIADLEAWPHLRTVSLTGLDIGDAEVALIARRRSLIALDLSATDVRSPADLAALPNLRIVGLSNVRLSADGERAAKVLERRGIEVVR
jgi:Leucine-rich repeat (LRR) protein